MSRPGAFAAAAAGGAAALWWLARERRVAREADPRRNLSGAGVPLRPQPRARAGVGDAVVLGAPDEPAWLARLAAWEPPPPRTVAGRALGYAWAAPVSAAGLLLGVLGAVRPRPVAGVLLFAPVRGLAARLLDWRGFAATALGHVVLARVEPGAALLAHELVHTRQAERFGILMGPLYVALLVRYGYARHPLERAARRAGRRAQAAVAG